MGNLLQQYAGTHYQHDVRGNRTRETAPSGHTTEYTYDAEDRLIAAKRYRRAPAAGDNATPEMQAKYGYDGFGRRLYKLVKQAKHPAQLTVFTWDGDLLTSEETFEGEYSFLERWAYPEAPTLTREVPDERYSLPIAQRVHSIVTQPRQRTHWLYEPESFIPAAQLAETYAHNVQRRTGTDAATLTTAGATTSEPRLYLIHTNHLGTPQELTDSDGTLQWAGQYRAWGELQKATDGQSNAASIDMRLRLHGQYHDEETGLHYNRFRYYYPRVGRFTTQDPISLAGGINLYQYAPNPVGWVDPYGLTKELVTYWPPNNGAVGKEKNITLPTGSIIDRYGYSGGTYTSPVNTPFAMRALPSDTINKPYSVYRVEKPIHNVAESRIAPWFGQLGGGMQYRLPKSVQEHIDSGHLKEIGKTSCGHKSSRK